MNGKTHLSLFSFPPLVLHPIKGRKPLLHHYLIVSLSYIIRFITFIERKLFYLLASFQSIDLFLLEQDSTLLDPLSSHSTGQNNESLLEENNCRMLQWLKIRSIFLFIFLFISSWINHPTTNNYHRRISMGIRNH